MYGTKRKTLMSRSERAYEAFMKMTPSLSNYASSVIGKRVMVKPSDMTYTDGKSIYLRPPLALAEDHQHMRSLCGYRDTVTRLQLCDACRVREDIMTGLHHEISHIAHGSFQTYGFSELTSACEAIDRYLPEHSSIAKLVRYSHDSANEKITSLKYANNIHAHLGYLNQAIEDHRINTAGFRTRPGLKDAMHAFSKKILEEGIENHDGTFLKWGDRDLDSQMMIAPLFFMEGLNLDGYLDATVVDTVQSQESLEILSTIETLPDSWAALEATIALLSIYRSAGFFQYIPEDQMTERQREAFEKMLKELSKALIDVIGHDAGDTQHVHSDHGIEMPGAASLGSTPDEEKEAMKTVIEFKEVFDGIPQLLDGVNINKPGKGYANRRSARGRLTEPLGKTPESIMGKIVGKGRLILEKNQRSDRQSGLKRGKIDASTLGRRAWNPDDGRIFTKKTIPGKRDHEVLIGFDISGSTRNNGRKKLITESVVAMAEFCHRLGIKFSIWAHTTDNYSMDMYEIKSVKEPWNATIIKRLEKLGTGDSNVDGHIMQFYRKQMDMSKATGRIIMYITDGVVPGCNSSEELPLFQAEIELCRKRGYTIFGIGVFTSSPSEHGLPTVEVHSPEDYPRVVDHLARAVLRS